MEETVTPELKDGPQTKCKLELEKNFTTVNGLLKFVNSMENVTIKSAKALLLTNITEKNDLL